MFLMCKCFIHVVAYVGTEVLFRCRATGLPPPRISWRKGSIPVSSLDLDRMQILPNGDLRVENITEDDNDVYTCIATNFVGPMETKEARLAVIVPVSVSVSPNNATVSPGDDVKITCSSRGTPRPIVEWYKDDNFMRSQGRTRVSRTSVIISQVQPSDSGYYQCQARHNYGSASDKMYLNVVVEKGNVTAFLIFNVFYKRIYHFFCSFLVPMRSTNMPVWAKSSRIFILGSCPMNSISRLRNEWLQKKREMVLSVWKLRNKLFSELAIRTYDYH